MSETLEHTARRIAEHGREALLARLRPAFEEAAAAHRDALQLDDEQLEQMVQRAADRADGLQWRRALASVAAEQLGIGLGEALGHPAVARAQAIVGAPSYEEALAALGADAPHASDGWSEPAGSEPMAAPSATEEDSHSEDSDEHDEHEGSDEPDEHEHSDEHDEHEDSGEYEEHEEHEDDDEAGPEPLADGTAEHAPVAAAEGPAPTRGGPPAPPTAHDDANDIDDGDGDGDGDETTGVRLRAIHLGGIANLSPAEGDLELHISAAGLDISRGPEQSVLGRLTWDEIVALETPEIGGRFRRKRQADAHLVIRSQQGSASFEIPGVTTHELREHLDPLLEQR